MRSRFSRIYLNFWIALASRMYRNIPLVSCVLKTLSYFLIFCSMFLLLFFILESYILIFC
uniref:Uncharacterized protein n=1 Tax=Brugia malayi TaxID=6279 RepID=A8Q717_BRUMA